MSHKEKDHNEGQAAGAKANFFDELEHLIDPFHSEHHHKGFEHGVDTKREKDPLGDFLNPFSSSGSRTEEEREEVASSDSDVDEHDDDDDDNYYPAYQPQTTAQTLEPAPEPKPITETIYTKQGTSISVSTFKFKTEAERQEFLRGLDQVRQEYGEGPTNAEEQRQLAHIVEKLDSDDALENLAGVIALRLMKDTQ